jgi:uncharacterized protein with NAD-binding domain and iron-sulfur cluster
VAIFGAGVAGLSAAHEFARQGYQVDVYETNAETGGFFRSARNQQDNGMPSEYSWHGIGPWYHNVFDVMRQIPFDKTGSVYDKALSRPIAFGLVPDEVSATFGQDYIFKKPKAFRMTARDKLSLGWGLAKTWTSNKRTQEDYALKNASEYWHGRMTDKGWKTWRATFGPWIGSDWANASLHHVGLFFRKNLMSGETHKHPADKQGDAWTHGSADGWLLLNGPSSEWWFDKWVIHLKNNNVTFHMNQELKKLDYDGNQITGAKLTNGKNVNADVYILATTPFAVVDILQRTPRLASIKQLNKFKDLTQDGPHTQVSFRIAFGENILWKKDRSAVVLADSEYNLTLFAEEQVWDRSVSLGRGVSSLWTGTACVSNTPGRVHGKPLDTCTKQEFIDEITAQIMECRGLEYMIKEANNGRTLKNFSIIRIEVWSEWVFSPKGIKPKQPKWVTSSKTQPHLPTQKTPIANLALAGAHTKTDADIWSIESAVESGRKAAQVFEPSISIIPAHKSMALQIIGRADDLSYSIGGPHILIVTAVGIAASLLYVLFRLMH